MKTIAINAEAKQNLNILLDKMHSKTETKIFNNGENFSTTYVTGGILKTNRNGIYGSRSILDDGMSTAQINEKSYVINQATGQVKAKEPTLKERFFGVSKKTVALISDTISRVKEHFDNPNIVEQWIWGIEGFTEKGAKCMDEAYNKFINETGSKK